MNDDAFEKKYNTLGLDIIKTHQMFCQEVLKLLPGQMAVVSNGRVRKELSSLSLFVVTFYFLEFQFPTKWNLVIITINVPLL